MPIYRYRCSQCKASREVMAKMSDPAPACVECGATPMVKSVARTAFQLKGGGWYAQGYTGSGSGGTSSADEGDTGGSADAGDGGSSGSDDD